MSDAHDDHYSPIKTPKQLLIVVILAFVVPITIILILAQLITGTHSSAPGVDAEAAKRAASERIKPVGEVTLAPGAASVAAPAATAAPAAAPASSPPAAATTAAAPSQLPAAVASSAKADGKKIYETTCVVCHGAGVAGAPKMGDKTAWAPRLQAGVSALHASAIKGKNAMPPKGGNLSLSDAEVNAAVDFIVAASR